MFIMSLKKLSLLGQEISLKETVGVREGGEVAVTVKGR
jgi:hypothetical protein